MSRRGARLPGLAQGEDIEQFLEARRAAGCTDADILAELQALIAPTRCPACRHGTGGTVRSAAGGLRSLDPIRARTRA